MVCVCTTIRASKRGLLKPIVTSSTEHKCQNHHELLADHVTVSEEYAATMAIYR